MAEELHGIVVHKSLVNLQSGNGVGLIDPERLLEGAGKKMRHKKIRNPDDIRTNISRAMIKEAAEA